LENLSQYLFLASGIKNGEGVWYLGAKNSDENILDEKKLLDCHRKELIGEESAKEIIFAINLNLLNLLKDLNKKEYLIGKELLEISLNVPLDVLEKIFDFWLELYKDKIGWETCLGLLKMRKRFSLSNLISSGSLKGKTRIWAEKIEELHNYEPRSIKTNLNKKPMWK